MKKNKVFFTDDHVGLRDLLAASVNSFEHFESVGVASNGLEAVAAFESGLETDIIILDLSMPEMDGYAVAEWLAAHRPAVKIIIMTLGVDKRKLSKLLDAGIYGIINKDSTVAELKEALETVAAGEQYFGNSATQDITDLRKHEQTVNTIKQKPEMTAADRQYIRHVAAGLADKEISHRMGLSKHATEQIRVNLFETYKVENRTALAMFGVKMGIVDI